MKPYIYLFAIVFSLANCMAQSDFRNGYIITNSGDTVYGQIDYKGNRSNAKECIFLKTVPRKKLNTHPVI
jgi:hypothetical protein